jgi:amino acid permease
MVEPEETRPLLNEHSEGAAINYIVTEASPLNSSSSKLHSRTKSAPKKDIGTLDSFVYILIQMYGYGVLALPVIYQQVGLVVATLALILFTFFFGLAPLLVAEATALIPGNDKFQKRIEFANLIDFYFSKRWYYIFQVLLAGNLLLSNLTNIRVSSQIVDSLIQFFFGNTVAVVFYPNSKILVTKHVNYFYGNDIVLAISLGYVILTVTLLPLGLVNLKANIKAQYVSCAVMIFGVVEFCWHYIVKRGIHWNAVPLFGTSYTQLVSVMIFTLSFTTLVPSWINMKKEHVSIPAIIWSTSLLSLLCNLIIGLLGAYAYPNLNSDDLLQYMSESEPITKVTTYCYTFAVISSSRNLIPTLYSIIR